MKRRSPLPRFNLRVQLTLIATASGGRKGPLPAEGFRTVLSSAGRHFSAEIFPNDAVVPGGAAVTCGVVFLLPSEALPYFPAGCSFDLWEGGRKGYGTVLEAGAATR